MTIKPLVCGYFKRYEASDFTDEYIDGLAERMYFFMDISNFPFHDTFNLSPKRVTNRAAEVYHFLYLVTEYNSRHWKKKLDDINYNKHLGGKAPNRKIHELITNAEKVLSDIQTYRTYSAGERAELEFELKLYIKRIKEKGNSNFLPKTRHYPKGKKVIEEDRDNYRYLENSLKGTIKKYGLAVLALDQQALIDYISPKA